MYMDKGRSGTHNRHIGNHPDDWEGLSENGRQYRSPITGQINNLSGANYWEMRKELPNSLSVSDSIDPDTFPTPSYYYSTESLTERSRGSKKQVDLLQEFLDNDTKQKEKESSFLDSINDDNIFKVMILKVKKMIGRN